MDEFSLPKFNLLDVIETQTSGDESNLSNATQPSTHIFDDTSRLFSQFVRSISQQSGSDSNNLKSTTFERLMSQFSGNESADQSHRKPESVSFQADVESSVCTDDGESRAGRFFVSEIYDQRISQQSATSAWSTDTCIENTSRFRVEVINFDIRDIDSVPVKSNKSPFFLTSLSKPEDEIKSKLVQIYGVPVPEIKVLSALELSNTCTDNAEDGVYLPEWENYSATVKFSTAVTYFVFIGSWNRESHHLLLLDYKQSLMCVILRVTSTLRNISKHLDTAQADLHYFNKHYREISSNVPVGECKVCDFDKIIVLEKRPQTIQFGHYYEQGLFQTFTLKCFSTDTVMELKKKFFEKFSNHVPTLKSVRNIYFSVDNELMEDSHCLGLKIEKELNDESFESLDNGPSSYVHIVPATSVFGLIVNYKKPRRYSSTFSKFVVVGQSSSTGSLRNEIAKILNCDNFAIKMFINGKKVEETTSLSSRKDFSTGSQITVEMVFKRKFKIKVIHQSTPEKEVPDLVIECFKLNSVQNLKEHITGLITCVDVRPSNIRMEFKGETMNEQATLHHYHIKTNQTIHAYVLDNQLNIFVKLPGCLKKYAVLIDDGANVTVADLLAYFSIMLKTPSDSLKLIHSGHCINVNSTLKAAKIHSRNLVVITKCDMPSETVSRRGFRVVYECKTCGTIIMKLGALINGILLFVPEGAEIHGLSSAGDEKPDEYSTLNLPRGIHWQEVTPTSQKLSHKAKTRGKKKLMRTGSGGIIVTPSQAYKCQSKGSISDTETMRRKYLIRARKHVQKMYAHKEIADNQPGSGLARVQENQLSVDIDTSPVCHSTPVASPKSERANCSSVSSNATFNISDSNNNNNTGTEVDKMLSKLDLHHALINRSNTVNDSQQAQVVGSDISMSKVSKHGNRYVKTTLQFNQRLTTPPHDSHEKLHHADTVPCLNGIDGSFLRDLASDMRKHWKDLARALKFDETDIDEIEFKYHKEGLLEMCYQMFLTWRKKHGIAATKSRLAAALVQSGLKSTADKFDLIGNLDYETT